MGNNIGVGVIVGLVAATSLYIWNSNNFTKEQKTFLLICIVFPPAQWLGIILVLIYNKNKENNSTEKITERKIEETKTKLDSSISNLTDLKEKGILTETEYNEKVNKIEAEKLEQNLKNSTEYKQLKSLFETGILSKDEFENKIKLIKNVSEKIVILKEISENNNLVEKTKEEKTEPKNENSGLSNMLLLFLFLILVIAFIIFNKRTPIISSVKSAVDSTTSNIENKNTSNFQKSIKINKYAYIIIKVKSPKLETSQIGGYKDYNTGFYQPEVNYCDVIWEEKEFITDVFEVEDYNEDTKYMHLDNAEKNVEEKFQSLDYNFSTSILLDCKDYDKKDLIKKENYKSVVIDRQILTFDSYSEASISRQKE